MHDFSETLLVARRQAGLSQGDCAHLLGVSRTHIARLEAGKATPNVTVLCRVALLFGRTMEGLSGPLFLAEAREMRDRLFDLPERRRGWLAHFNRSHTLEQMAGRVEQVIEAYEA